MNAFNQLMVIGVGVVNEIFVADAQAVEFDQPLIVIE
jgi:biotin carboxyl carrier protein